MSIAEFAFTSTIARQSNAFAIPLTGDAPYREWYTMLERNPLASPFQHPEYVVVELENMPKKNLTPILLQLGDNEDCEGIGILVPKLVRTKQVGGIGLGWTISGLRLSGEGFLTNDASVESQTEMLSLAAKYCTDVGADFLLIEDLDELSPLYQSVQNISNHGCRLFDAREVQPRWRINFPTKEEDYWKTFSPRTRRVFRSNLKKMGHAHLERITEVEQVPEFLRAAHEISKQSWQSRQFGLRIRNDLSELKRLTILAQLGFLRSYLLRIAGKPAAFALSHQRGGYFRYEEVAYCAEFSPLSPGVTALQQTIEDLYRFNPPTCFDFGGGDAEYKRQFGNHESRSQSMWLVPPTWRAGAALAYLNGCRGIRSIGRHAVKSGGFGTKARQWLRYGGRASHPRPADIVAAISENESRSTDTTGA